MKKTSETPKDDFMVSGHFACQLWHILPHPKTNTLKWKRLLHNVLDVHFDAFENTAKFYLFKVLSTFSHSLRSFVSYLAVVRRPTIWRRLMRGHFWEFQQICKIIVLVQFGVTILAMLWITFHLNSSKQARKSSEDTHFTGYARFEKVWAG